MCEKHSNNDETKFSVGKIKDETKFSVGKIIMEHSNNDETKFSVGKIITPVPTQHVVPLYVLGCCGLIGGGLGGQSPPTCCALTQM